MATKDQNKNNKKCTSKFNAKQKSDKFPRKKGKEDYDPHSKEHDVSDRNDPAWYTKAASLVRDATNFSMFQVSGLNYKLGFDVEGETGTHNFASPGAMIINYVPTAGKAMFPTDPINVAAQAIYSYVRSQNSGAKNYDSTDLMMYIMAVAQIHATLTHFQRALGMSQTYYALNRYMPKALVSAMGFDFDDIISHQDEVRNVLNTAALKLNAFKIPSNINYFRRVAWMNDGYYVESNSQKSQFYVFNPTGYYVYSPRTADTGTELIYNSFPSNIGYLQMQNILNAMIDPMLTDTDVGNMSGDILKAYGDVRPFETLQLQAGFSLSPMVMDDNLRAQIENLTIAPIEAQGSHKIMQNLMGDNPYITQSLVWTSMISANRDYYKVMAMPKRVINFHTTSPDTGMIMEATRLMSYAPFYKSDDTHWKVRDESAEYGTEIVCGVRVITLNSDGSYRSASINQGVTSITQAYIASSASYTNFGVRPMQISFKPTAPYDNLGYWGDLEDYGIIVSQDISNIHQAALISLFDVPGVLEVK